MAVAATLAEWLRSSELVEVVEDEGTLAAWRSLAADSPLSSPLALRSAAKAEGQSQMAFLGHSLAVETIEIDGRRAMLVGHSRRIRADVEGYANAPSVFVIGADERSGGTTLLTVLRRLEVA